MITLMTTLSLMLAPCGTADCQPLTVTAMAASHHGVYDGHTLTWRTTLVAQDGELLTPSTYRVRFAAPLAATTAVSGDGVVDLQAVRDDQGRVVAVDAPRAAWSEPQHAKTGAWTRQLRLVVRMPAVEGGGVPVVVPAVEGQVVQKVVMSDAEGLRFAPEANLGIEQHLRFFVQGGVSADERRRCEVLVGEREVLPRELGVFLRADARLYDAGLTIGRLSPTAQARQYVALVAGGCTLGLLGLLGLAYRLLARPARLERLLALVSTDPGSAGEQIPPP